MRDPLPPRVLDKPRLILLLYGSIFIVALIRLADTGAGDTSIRVDPDIGALLPKYGLELAQYRSARETFRSDDLLFVVWQGEQIFQPIILEQFKRLSKNIERLPGVQHVESLANAVTTVVHEEYSEVATFLEKTPSSEKEAQSIRDSAQNNPLYSGYLIAQDGTDIVISVRFDADLGSKKMLEIVASIQDLVDAVPVDVISYLSGPLFVRLEISRLLLSDLYRVLPLAILASLLISAISFRHLHGVLIPFVANTFSLSVTMGLFVYFDQQLNYVTVILAPTVYVVGFAYALHVVSDFDEYRAKGDTPGAAARAAWLDIWKPVSLSALTTAIGFLSLCASDIQSIRTFGMFASLGTLIAWTSALVLVPCCLSLLPGKKFNPLSANWQNTAGVLTTMNDKYRAITLMCGILFATVSIFGAMKITVGTDYLANFSADNPVKVNFTRLNTAFAGAVPLQIVLSGDKIDTFKSPAALNTIRQMQRWLERQPEIGGTYSLLDYVVELERTLAPDLADDDPVPESADMVHHLILLGGTEDIRRFVNPAFDKALIQVRANSIASHDLNALGEKIRGRLAAIPPGLNGHVTGSSVLIADTLDEVTEGQIRSLCFAVLPIFVILNLLFRSFRVAMIALIPNVLPILGFFGFLGFSGISLNFTTSLVAAVVLGIAVDDSIHFFARLKQATDRGLRENEAINFALLRVIRPVTFTTAGLALGFLALFLGELKSQAEFGFLAALTLVLAWLLDLTFTPALARVARLDRATGTESS